MFNLTPPTTRLSAAELNPDALCLQVWRVESIGAAKIASATVSCIFSGRTFPKGTVIKTVCLDDGREGVFAADEWGSPGTVHGDEVWTTACHDMTRFAEYAARPDCQRVTICTKTGEPTTYHRDGAAWLKWGRTKTSASTLARAAAKASAFAAWSR